MVKFVFFWPNAGLEISPPLYNIINQLNDDKDLFWETDLTTVTSVAIKCNYVVNLQKVCV